MPWDGISKAAGLSSSLFIRGMYERGGGTTYKKWEELFPEWIKDMGRTIDYLETRQDIDIQNLAYVGLSLGARLGPGISIYEKRIKVLVLLSQVVLGTRLPSPNRKD